MKVFTSVFFIIIFLLSSCSKIDEADKLNFSISYLEDVKDVETIQTISKQKLKNLESPNIGFKNGVYWFKVILDEQPIDESIVFDLPESNIHKITVYQNNEIIPWKELDNSHLSLLIDTVSRSNIYYFKVYFNYEVFFPLHVNTFKKSQLKEKYGFFVNGIFYGFVLMVLIINSFFYFSLKDKTFLFYCFFLILITIIFLDYDGLFNSTFPDSYLRFHRILTHFLLCLSGALFANQFLNIKYYLPKSNFIGIVLLLVTIISYLLFVFTSKFLFVAIGDTFSMLVLLHYWCIGIIISKKYKFAKFFVFGYSLILFSSFLFVIPRNWGLNTFSVSLNTVKFGALFEMLILTYAITYRIKILHEENDRFKKEINQYLNDLQVLKKSNLKESHKMEELLKSKHDLSAREIEVLILIYKGYTNKRIGEDLFVSLNTVKYHIRNIYEKLNIKNKNEAIDVFTKIKNQ
ncbi:7TM diverse intracellular signaling domain-containing protein [Christiangramia sp. SM2212]|uniref:7TM diverse intracellular signaling domain-containing protein n=1 Tax=Christiangramia sediminicola TaxID=3073267 RepID=A0ABU1EUK0_9FLAO|nr:7TM diverse intracellular signaling domain-containing protein [Christiangramia sp. SM2212]MDR5592061.1 7TM diverse intracellular signaling domain-containing protein [Christiangramia sp. SM2212]